MTKDKFEQLAARLLQGCEQIRKTKGGDYASQTDILANFWASAEEYGITPMQALGVFMDKHQRAIKSYIRTDGESQSEPILERIKDNINYLLFLAAMVVESGQPLESAPQPEC